MLARHDGEALHNEAEERGHGDLCINQPVSRAWLRRAVRNRYRYAIEQASRRWRGGRRGDSGRRRREILIYAQDGDAAVLDLRVAEVADRRLVAEAPEVALRDEVERVPEACAGDAGQPAVI